MERIAVKPGKGRNWVKARCTGGYVRSLPWNALAGILKEYQIVDGDNQVVRIELDNYGLHVYMEDGE